MLELNDISFQYGFSEEDREDDLQEINLKIPDGQFIVLAGESGCGKTTLSRVLNGLCPSFYEGILAGSYCIDGENTEHKTIDQIGLLIGSVFQDPRSQFFATNSTDEIVLAMENRAYDRDVMHARLQEVAHQMDMEALLGQSMFRMSSGEKQKIAIASVCTVKPKVIMLDEPSANLDPDAMQKLARMLKERKQEGYTIIVLEHRLYYLRELMDRLLVLGGGRIIRDFDRAEIARLTGAQMEALGLRVLEETRLQEVPMPAVPDAPFVEMTHICYTVRRREILRDINIRVQKGEILALTGQNGAGKSTTCRILAGLVKESGGEVYIGGQKCRKGKRIRHNFFVQQDADYQLYASTVYEEITLGIRPKEIDCNEVTALLERLHLRQFVNRHPGSLSGGQKQRVLIAASILKKKELLILDEPTSGLDGRHMRELAALLREIAAKGTTILLITHDMEFISLVADSTIELANGRTSEKRKVLRRISQN